jgi:hypothetical protein
MMRGHHELQFGAELTAKALDAADRTFQRDILSLRAVT